MNKRLLLVPPLLLAAVWWLQPDETVPEPAPAEEKPALRASRSASSPAPRLPWVGANEPEDTGAEPEPVAEEVDTAYLEDTGADTGEALSPPLVSVWLTDADGNPIDDGMVVSPECEIWAWAGGEGPRTIYTPEGTCSFQGRRRDGLLWGRSEWVTLDLLPGETYELELVIPMEKTGGLGVMISEHEFGIEVQRVWPGTPAAEMGLAAGDIITEVDGLPSSTLTMEEFIQVMTGPVGTEVDFALAYEADTGFVEEEITLTRAWLE